MARRAAKIELTLENAASQEGEWEQATDRLARAVAILSRIDERVNGNDPPSSDELDYADASPANVTAARVPNPRSLRN